MQARGGAVIVVAPVKGRAGCDDCGSAGMGVITVETVV